MGRTEAALADLSSALLEEHHFAQALSNRGNCFRRLGRQREARDDYNAALELDSSDAKVWHNRGVLHEEMGNLLGAQLDLRRAMELDASHADAAYSYARVSEALRERSEVGSDGAVGQLVLELGATTQGTAL
jgi:tetratricopeptide (TPR) repeat protein